MSDLNQKIIKFNFESNFKDDDFFVSKSNKHVYDLINKWPKWEKNFLNISGERFSGKSHLVDIFLKKHNGIKFNSNSFNNEKLEQTKNYKNIILENLSENVDEKLIYTLINFVEQENKYLIITSTQSIVDLRFELVDLKSRFQNFLIQYIEKPDDEMMFALILKNFSDRQITLDKKLINYIIKHVDRSYSKIYDFIYKIDEMSLKKKKSINFKIIKDMLEE